MASDLILRTPLWLIFIAMTILFLLASEGGFRIGRRVKSGIGEPSKPQITAIEGAILGLVALLLAFTFSMSAARFDARRQLVTGEANAIGTAYLRADFLSNSDSKIVKDLLREYVDVRLEFFESGINPVHLSAAIQNSEFIHEELWELSSSTARKSQDSPTIALFVESINEVIDMHTMRVAALNSHVPESILLLLLVVATISSAVVGYGNGLGERRILLTTFTASILIAFVILIILDLDRPRRGIIEVSQGSMISLQDSLR